MSVTYANIVRFAGILNASCGCVARVRTRVAIKTNAAYVV